MAPVAASLGCEAIIYLSAWHGLFFDELGGQPPHATLALMEAAGYSGASLMRQRIMGGEGRELLLNHLHHATNTPGKHVEALWGSPLANLSWTQAFFAAAAASACDGKHHVHLHHVVERANVVVSEAAARGCWSQHDVLQDAYLHDAANCSNSNSSSSLIFSLEDVANASAEVPAALRGVYEDARLYAGLSMGASFPLMRPLAKLLCLFIYQDDAVVKDSLFAEMPAPQSSSSAAAATTTSSASLQWARSAGVVAGIIEYALHTASAAPRAVFSALHAQVRDADATHEASTSCGLLGGLSTSPAAPEDAAAIVAATAMLLRALMEQMIELDGWRQRHSSSANNNNATKKKSGAADGCGALLSAHILHNIHELLFASILGTSTQNLAARPTTSTTAAHDHCGMRCATQRGLTLMEVDVLTRQLLPALLPQVGLEWPWSEMLRQCRTLERHAQGSQLAHHPSMVGAAHHEALTVVWSSEQLLEALLTALAPRSYAQRLQNSLPGSYDALLAELQLAANNNNNNTAAEDDGGDGAATATTTTTDPLFQLPAYYRQAGEVMVEHLSKVGLGLSLQWQEAERVLRDAVNVLPMIVRLRALAPAASTSGRLNQPHVEHDEDEEMMMMDHHAPSGNDSWSRAAVQSWVNRYMAEVLLSAVVVRTQLAVPSHVQQLLRALAPLFHRLRAAIPRRTSWVERHGDDGLRFTMEAVRLMEHVGFRGYSLEWLPSVVPEDGGGASSTTTSLASSSATSLPYSIFAAVAYHMDIHLLHDGLRGAAHPAGPRASVRGAPSSNAQRYLSSHSSSADDAHARERATRFFSRAVGLHVLAATTAASEVEGSVLMSVSRAVQSAAGDASSSAAAATHHLASTTARDQALRQLYAWMWSVEMARRAAVREEAGQSSHHPSSSKRGRADDGGAAEPLTAEQREELLVGASYLLQNGPASMDGVVELSDVLTSVLQAFLPTAAAMDSRGGGDAVKGVASLLLRAGEEWSAEMMGGAASRAQLRVLMQQHASGAGNDAVIQSFVEQHGGLTKVEPSSLRSLVMARLHNSGTVDASVVAREMLRLVPTRLLHKLRRRRALEEELHELLTSDAAMASLFPGNARSEDATSWKRAVNLRLRHDAVLLQRQWKQWLELLTSVGLLADRDSNNNNNNTSSPPLSSTMEWLWSSPYTTELS